jgi:hypothetical protein
MQPRHPEEDQSFREEQMAIYDIADLFANRLLTDDVDMVEEDWAPDDIGEYRFTHSWTGQLIDTIDMETRNFNGAHPENMPGRIHELHRQLNGFFTALGDLLSGPEGVDSISNHTLLDVERRLSHYQESEASPDWGPAHSDHHRHRTITPTICAHGTYDGANSRQHCGKKSQHSLEPPQRLLQRGQYARRRRALSGRLAEEQS